MKTRVHSRGAAKNSPFRQFSIVTREMKEGIRYIQAIDRKEDEELREKNKYGWAYKYVKGILI